MSYSFSASGATKAEAIAAIGPKFDEVVTSQPVHASDREAAVAAAAAFVGLMAEPGEGQQLSVSVSGSLQWPYREGADAQTQPTEFIGASVSVYVSTGALPKVD